MTVGTFLFTSIPFQCLAQTQQRGAHIWPIWGPCLLHNNVHKVSLFETPCCITTTQSGNGPQTCPMGHKNGSLGARQTYKVRGRWRGCTQRPTQWRVPASLELTEFGGIPSEESCGAWPWKLKNKFLGARGRACWLETSAPWNPLKNPWNPLKMWNAKWNAIAGNAIRPSPSYEASRARKTYSNGRERAG